LVFSPKGKGQAEGLFCQAFLSSWNTRGGMVGTTKGRSYQQMNSDARSRLSREGFCGTRDKDLGASVSLPLWRSFHMRKDIDIHIRIYTHIYIKSGGHVWEEIAEGGWATATGRPCWKPETTLFWKLITLCDGVPPAEDNVDYWTKRGVWTWSRRLPVGLVAWARSSPRRATALPTSKATGHRGGRASASVARRESVTAETRPIPDLMPFFFFFSFFLRGKLREGRER
jgi:hypothetical protein